MQQVTNKLQVFFFFFDMSTQEGEEEFELVTSALLSVVPNYKVLMLL